jgi:hypothetical protein
MYRLALFLLTIVSLGLGLRLNGYGVLKDKISISGFSSGAVFTVQFHVAYSDTIMGAGVVAGAPYYCAENSFLNVLMKCSTTPFLLNIDDLVQKTRFFATKGYIDNVDGLREDKVMLISGKLDRHVLPGVMEKLYEYYENFIPDVNISKNFDTIAPHAMLSVDTGVESCLHLFSPYVNNCQFSAANAILLQIYGDITLPTKAECRTENLLKFDQSEFLSERAFLANVGYLYVPTSCKSGTKRCRLHVALHGCGMSSDLIGTDFVLRAGYNDIAEINDIIILYPQIYPTDLGLTAFIPPWNLHGCYDFWGYTNSDYAFKTGPQMAAIKAMIDRITEPSAGQETTRSSEL